MLKSNVHGKIGFSIDEKSLIEIGRAVLKIQMQLAQLGNFLTSLHGYVIFEDVHMDSFL
jgi:hypothetical protein